MVEIVEGIIAVPKLIWGYTAVAASYYINLSTVVARNKVFIIIVDAIRLVVWNLNRDIERETNIRMLVISIDVTYVYCFIIH